MRALIHHYSHSVVVIVDILSDADSRRITCTVFARGILVSEAAEDVFVEEHHQNRTKQHKFTL